jgi:hypothetical protein
VWRERHRLVPIRKGLLFVLLPGLGRILVPDCSQVSDWSVRDWLTGLKNSEVFCRGNSIGWDRNSYFERIRRRLVLYRVRSWSNPVRGAEW